MEAEVSALMGAADEALWKRVGLFASTDELCTGTGIYSKLADKALVFQASSGS
jgi:hypothetical protein